MKTKVLYLIPVILILRMTICSDAISQNPTMSVSGDEYWDEQFGVPGMNVEVNCFLKNDGLLYAGGEFTMAGGNAINRIATWDGTSWSNVGFGFDENAVFTIEFYKNELYAGGIFYRSNNQKMWFFAKWNDTEWIQPGSDIDLQVNCLTSSGDLLYLGGSMISTAGIELNGIAAWDGSEFHSLAGGFWKPYSPSPSVSDIKFIGGDLFAGGIFTKAGGVEAMNIAKWDGTSWSPLGGGIDCEGCVVNSLAVIGTELYVAGGFSEAGGVAANNIAKWDGTQWSPLGSGTNGPVFVLTVIGDKLYAGGSFSSAGGASAKNIAMWDGNQWSALGNGTDNWVKALYADGDILYVGGRFSMAGNKNAYKIALWNPALSVEDHDLNPNAALLNIYPNPVSVSTEIKYQVKKAGHVRLKISDINGRELKTLYDGMQHPGEQQLTFETTGLQPGIYFVRLAVGNKSVTKKLIIQ